MRNFQLESFIPGFLTAFILILFLYLLSIDSPAVNVCDAIGYAYKIPVAVVQGEVDKCYVELDGKLQPLTDVLGLGQ